MTEDERNKVIEQKLEQWYATVAQFQPQLKDALTAEQYKRLQQIEWQAMGTAAFSEPEVIAALAITKEQQQTISSLVNEYRSKRMTKLREGDGSGGTGRDLNELATQMRELSKEQDTKINRRPDEGSNADQFSTLKGPAFPVQQLLDGDQLPRRN